MFAGSKLLLRRSLRRGLVLWLGREMTSRHSRNVQGESCRSQMAFTYWLCQAAVRFQRPHVLGRSFSPALCRKPWSITGLAAGHEPVCFVHAKMTPIVCALLEFTTAPLPILRVSGVVDIGITTTKSPALDIAALCLDSWPAAIFTQIPISDSCQRLHVSLQHTHHCKMILR